MRNGDGHGGAQCTSARPCILKAWDARRTDCRRPSTRAGAGQARPYRAEQEIRMTTQPRTVAAAPTALRSDDRTPRQRMPNIRLRDGGLRTALPWLLGLTLAGTAQAGTGWAIEYFSFPGQTTSWFWDIDNQGRLAGTAGDDGGIGFLLDASKIVRLTAPNGSALFPVSLSSSGLIAGYHDDPTRSYQSTTYVWDPVSQTQIEQTITAPVVVGTVGQAGGPWQTVELPLAGIQQTTLRSISPNGRYVIGQAFSDSTFSLFRLDLGTGSYSLLPSARGSGFAVAAAVDNEGRVIGSSNAPDRAPLIYDPLTGTRGTLPLFGHQRLSPRAVNADGLMAGWLYDTVGDSLVQSAWVGTAQGIEVLPTKAGFSNAVGLNDLGQVVGSWSPVDGSRTEGFIATPVVLPEAGTAAGEFRFAVAVRADVPIFLDPEVAVGYRYQLGVGDPLFKTVMLPQRIGDDRYTLLVGGRSLDVQGGQLIDFTALGFAAGVAEFTVTGIETGAMLDPNDARAFVTRVSFMADGRFTGTQLAITAQVPEPGTWALWAMGLIAGAGLSCRRPLRPRGTS
ncbi:PEP-CTERM sorting domain-containing protein [Ideonella sp. DXS22W]|uniref:PEP-CTERM sorting domain-containing protein n=1 Tax=Pseudaquabacterium inlustre TaxID=2984192 RepID=A0ABU9CKL0_9BURK